MRGLFLCLCVFVFLCAAKTKWYELESYTFEDYVREFGKFYNAEEYHVRRELFENRLKQIKLHNSQQHSWKKGVNRLTDRTEEEFRRMLGFNKALGAEHVAKATPTTAFSEERSIPSSIDWRQSNIISPVKDQGQCGSCWTFATAESIESYWAMKTGMMETLSEQQIASCTPNPNDCGGTGGCGGGIAEIAYQQVINMGGIASEWTYPYLSYQGDNYGCRFSKTDTPAVVQLKNYTTLPSNELTPVMNALATHGPLAVNVDATAWNDYDSGVFSGCNMQSPDIDHVVQLVGYGVDSDSNLPYWLIRNSWSPSWGEGGYIRILRENKPPCGIDTTPQAGTGCNGGPANVTVCGNCGILYSVSYPEVA